MTLEQSALPMFAYHQTFHPRFGWIKKGFDRARSNPDVFNAKDASVCLGVGKNMVQAIRFWCNATRVITRQQHPDRPRMTIAVPTHLGVALLDDEVGLDPYLEDPTTLWILHWQAVSAASQLPVWWSTLNDFSAVEFSEDDLLRFCIDEVAATTWQQPAKGSIQKDVDCLLRMYTKRETRGRETLDDLLDSPFRELGLIQSAAGARGSYRFTLGQKPGLSAAVVTYACLDYLARTDSAGRTVSLTRLATDSGSPGRLLKLTEDAILSAIEESMAVGHGLSLARPAGATQLVVEGTPEDVAHAVLWAHHRERRPSIPCEISGSVAGTGARRAAWDGETIARLVRSSRPRHGRGASKSKGSAA